MLEEGCLRLYVTAGYVLITPAILTFVFTKDDVISLGIIFLAFVNLTIIRQSNIVEFPKNLMTSSATFAKSLMYRIDLSSPFVDVQKHAMIIQRKCCPRSKISCFPSCVVTKLCFCHLNNKKLAFDSGSNRVFSVQWKQSFVYWNLSSVSFQHFSATLG